MKIFEIFQALSFISRNSGKEEGGEREGEEGRGGAGKRAKCVGRREGAGDGEGAERKENDVLALKTYFFARAPKARGKFWTPWRGGGSAPPGI